MYGSVNESASDPYYGKYQPKPKNVRPTLPKKSQHDPLVKLKNYIVNAKTQANYQPVMIRALLKNNGYCSKYIIANELYLYNTSKKKDPTFYKYVPVFGVLEKNGIVMKDIDGYLLIGAKNLTEDQKNTLVDLCDEKILQDPTSVLPEKKIVYAIINDTKIILKYKKNIRRKHHDKLQL